MTMVVNKELALSLEQSEIDALHSRLSAIQAMDGNPMGVDIQTFGQATAFSVMNIPGPSFNTVKGLREGDEEHVEGILDFYRQKDIPVRFELTPAYISSELLPILNKWGFYQHDFHTTLYAPLPQETEPIDPRLSIRKLQKKEFELFADIYTKGFEMPSFLKSGVAQNNKILYTNPNWRFYLASVENKPAGIGVLFIKDQIATLAASTTIPTLRNGYVRIICC